MDSFLIRSTSGVGTLEFFERTPIDPDRRIERYKVRLIGQDLSAVARVYAVDDSEEEHPAPFFVRMAENWRGWTGELEWGSPDGELGLQCTQDRAGHVWIRIELRSGRDDDDWSLATTIRTEAGQLDGLARQAASFFGR